MLAALMEQHGVCIVFTGSEDIEERRQDYWRILGKSTYRVISYLQQSDALQLMQRPVDGRVCYQEGSKELIYRLTAGQPFYTQAVCQSLIDHLNERRTSQVGPEEIDAVVREIIDNPFPQMIFLWDGWTRDEKIALSLLAEHLSGGDRRAGVADLFDALQRGGYTVTLAPGRLAAALESLFRKDFLLKEGDAPPAYAFRMDLWRLWIRRMHSVWQVLSEEGMVTRADRLQVQRRRRGKLVGLSAAALVLAAAAVVRLYPERESTWRTSHALVGTTATGRERSGAFGPSAGSQGDDGTSGTIAAGQSRGAAAGRYDAAGGGGRDRAVASSETGSSNSPTAHGGVQNGGPESTSAGPAAAERPGSRVDLAVEPPEAEISMDGKDAGTGAYSGVLAASARHQFHISAPGYAESTFAFIGDGRPASWRISLRPTRADLAVRTDPPGASISVEGVDHGLSPIVLRDLPLGPVHVAARSAGFTPAETVLVLQQKSQDCQLVLRAEPPAALTVMGDQPGTIYVDGVLVKEDVQNSGRHRLPAGRHRIQIMLVSGSTIDDSLRIEPGESVTYDYSLRRVVHRTPAGTAIGPGGTPVSAGTVPEIGANGSNTESGNGTKDGR